MNDKVLAWHFLRDDGTTGYEHLEPVVGETLVHEGELKLYSSGLHASIRAIDAIQYAPGSLVCRVEMGGAIVHGEDKLVASERTIIWQADATNVLHEFACLCAENALHFIPEQERGLFEATIAAKRAWMRGELSDDELSAARAAARDAARAAAWDTAWAAAWDTARAAAWDTAWAAARAAARAAAWDTARAAARAAQNERLERMLMELAPKGDVVK